jgi:hypothetical protein
LKLIFWTLNIFFLNIIISYAYLFNKIYFLYILFIYIFRLSRFQGHLHFLDYFIDFIKYYYLIIQDFLYILWYQNLLFFHFLQIGLLVNQDHFLILFSLDFLFNLNLINCFIHIHFSSNLNFLNYPFKYFNYFHFHLNY